jgi:iron(III) transport system permease protein
MPVAQTIVLRQAADQRVARAALWAAGALFLVALVLPMGMLLLRAVQDRSGAFIGLANFATYVTTPSLAISMWNSAWTSALSTAIVVPLAFVYAYALTRSCIPMKGLFRAVMLIPILAPTLLPALAMVTLFGNQGLFRPWLPEGFSVYGPWGIVAAQVFANFPHAAIILSVALATSDARLYEAATVLRAGHLRIFLTVTLPAATYGLVSAAVVAFTLAITDFGIPKVISGNFNVLATDVYKQVVGQQNLNLGAVVGLVLLAPTVVGFLLERWAQRQRAATLSGRAMAYVPAPRLPRDLPLLLLALGVAGLLIGIVGVAAWSSLITFWPWNLSLTLANYEFGRFDADGWSTVLTSVHMASLAALIGTPVIFLVAYLLERGPSHGPLGAALRLAVTLPLAIPGLVLGLAYILFFNHPANPARVLYGTLAILVLNSIIHFYTVGHLTATTAIRQLDPEFEAVGASLRVPLWHTFARVTVPISLPAIIDIAVYLFVNAMTTVSAVIFLYGPGTKTASVAVVHMDEAGQQSAAAAMACVILLITASAKLLQLAAAGAIDQATQRWRRR